MENLMNRLLIASIFLLAACARKPEETGFLTSYTNLQPLSSTYLRYIAPNHELSHYDSFIIEPITIKFYDSSDEKKVNTADLDHLKNYLSQAVEKELSAQYSIVTKPGPGVAILRIAITDLQASSPALNVLPQTQLLGLGLGEVSVEAELLDSQTHTQLAAVVESEQVKRFSRSDFSDWGGIEGIMDVWAKQLANRINEAHS
jgi:hypothetical protein